MMSNREIQFYCEICGQHSKYSGESRIRNVTQDRKKFGLEFPTYHLCAICFAKYKRSEKRKQEIANRSIVEVLDLIVNKEIFRPRRYTQNKPRECAPEDKMEMILSLLSNGKLIKQYAAYQSRYDDGYPLNEFKYLHSIFTELIKALEPQEGVV